MASISAFAIALCRGGSVWAVLGLIFFTQGGIARAQERARPTAGGEGPVAFINLDRSPEGALLESHLRSGDELKWWPRRKTQELVRSHALSTRIDLPILEADEGHTLDALPLLIIVTTPVNESGRSLQVAVCEAERGLRLGMQRLPLLPGAVIDIEALAKNVKQSLSRREGWREVWAVPPLLSRDLVRDYDDLSLQYAAEMESVLLARAGAVTVEFEHAAVVDVARRAARRAAPIERPTPSFVLGEYRNEGSGEARRITISLTLRRGERDERERSQTVLTPAAAEEFVRQFAGESGKYLNGADLIVDQPATEHLLLGSRFELLRDAGGWPGAWRLAEAQLLLDQHQAPLRTELLTVLARLTAQHIAKAEQLGQTTVPGGNVTVHSSQPNPRAAEAIELAMQAINAHRRGLAHIHFLLDGEEHEKNRLLGASKVHEIRSALPVAMQLRVDFDRRMERLMVQLIDERRDAFARMYLEGARLGRVESPEFLSGQTGEDCLRDALSTMVATQDFPNAEQRMRMLVERALGLSGSRTDASGFVAQLAASPNANLQVAARRGQELLAQRKLIAEQAAARRATGAPRPATPSEPADSAEPADVEFEEVKLPWKRTVRNAPYMLGEFQLCLAAGNADLFFGSGQLWLMKTKGEAKLLWEDADRQWAASGPAAEPAWACFDTRYAWIPLSKRGAPQRLLLVDPQDEKVIEWNTDDGLPLVADVRGPQSLPATLAVTALAPGKVCIAGSSGRGWLATAQYDPENGKFAKVFFEARQEASETDERETFKRTLAFRPAFMFTLAGRREGEEPSQRVIVGRNTGNYRATDHPLVVDPETGEVEVVQSPLKNFIVRFATGRGESMYWVDTKTTFDSSTNQPKRETRTYRFGYPEFKQQLVFNHGEIGGQQSMAIGFGGEQMHCVGSSWLTAAGPDQPLRVLRGNLPPPRNPASIHRWALVPSAHYGWIIYSPGQGQAYAAVFKGEAARSGGRSEIRQVGESKEDRP